jgi:S1-C subfamily serine protease
MAEGVKLLSAVGLKVRIAVGSAAVLFVGAWIAPPATPTVEVSQERAAPLLEERIQLRESVRPFQGVDGAATGVIPYGVAILPPPAVAPVTGGDFGAARSILLDSGFGVRISATEIATHVDALDGRSAVRVWSTDGAVTIGTVTAYDASGIVLLRTESSGLPVAPLAADLLPPGALAVGASPGTERTIVRPIFITSASSRDYTIGSVEMDPPPGMPIYTLDGALAAISAGSGGRAVPVEPVISRLRARAADGPPSGALGITHQRLPEPLHSTFGDRGLVVTRVVPAGPADRAGIRPGDVIVELEDRPVDDSDSLSQVLDSTREGTVVRVDLRRSGRLLTLEVTLASPVAIAAQARRDAEPGGTRAADSLSATVLEDARLSADARILSINGRSVSSPQQAEREFRRLRTPAAVLVQHGRERFFVAVAPR